MILLCELEKNHKHKDNFFFLVFPLKKIHILSWNGVKIVRFSKSKHSSLLVATSYHNFMVQIFDSNNTSKGWNFVYYLCTHMLNFFLCNNQLLLIATWVCTCQVTLVSVMWEKLEKIYTNFKGFKFMRYKDHTSFPIAKEKTH